MAQPCALRATEDDINQIISEVDGA
eukprot:SAG22_NODE_9635_length_578_cov_1.054280_1_plen_24_part_10